MASNEIERPPLIPGKKKKNPPKRSMFHPSKEVVEKHFPSEPPPEFIPISPVETKELTIRSESEIQEFLAETPSATRSDGLVKACLERGLGPEKIAETLHKMLEASTIRTRFEFDEKKRKMVPVKFTDLDFNIVKTAVRELIDIFGFKFELPKNAEQAVPTLVLQMYNDFRNSALQKNPFEIAQEVGMEIDGQGNVVDGSAKPTES